MLQALSILKSPGTAPRRKTESFVFYLHYRVTFLMLMFACVLISTRQFVGDKIQCLVSPGSDISKALLDSYCWAASTYSVSSGYFKEVGIEVPHPGVDASENEGDYTYRNYYQYVHLVLFLQALLFYVPHLIWKGIDRDHITKFYETVNSCKTDNVTDKLTIAPFEAASTYIEERWGSHKEYALKYMFCELLSTANLMGQCYLLDVFLHGEFLGLGHFYMSHYNADRLTDPIRLFPLVTSCYFKKFGASGYVDTIDVLCVLPINALNVKIYLFIWSWFAVLLGVSLCSLVNLGLAMLVPKYRNLFLKSRTLFCKSRVDQASYVDAVTSGDFGDWFVLSCIKDNMDPMDFSRLMDSLWSKLSTLGTETKEP